MTNKKYLKENKLYESHKHFMRLCEWSYVPKTLDEDEDELENDQNQDQAQMPPQDPSNEGNPQPLGNEPQPTDNPLGDESDASMDDIMGDMPQGEEDVDFSGEGDMEGTDGMENSEDDVIDVDDLTNAQEELNDKMSSSTQELGQVDNKISSLLQAIEKMESMISNNNNQIQSLKSEFEKRNPTQTEKLNLRALDSYPYNIKPNDYWDEKAANSNYEGYSDNDEKPSEQYKITNNDVDNLNDSQMNASFNIEDDMNQDLKKIFNLR